MNFVARVCGCAFMLVLAALPAVGENSIHLEWEQLPPLPESMGRPLWGVSNGALVVANTPEIYFLPPGVGAWQTADETTGNVAYDEAVQADGDVWLIDAQLEDSPARPLRLTWNGTKLEIARVSLTGEREASLWEQVRAADANLAILGPGHKLRVDASTNVQFTNIYTDTTLDLGSLPDGATWGGESVLLVDDNHPVLIIDPAHIYRGSFVHPAARLGVVDYGAIGLYMGVLVLMGWYFSRRESSTEQYFLGGRKIPWWAVGMSIFGTSLSAITYLSIPAQAYATNWVYFNANMAIFLSAPIVTLFYISHYRKWPIATAYEYLERRFNVLARIYGSICFLTFQTGRVGIVMLLPAIALSASTGMDRGTCIVVMGVLATLYTVMGGIEAVIWTDVLQAIVLTCGAVLALILVVANVEGGALDVIREAAAADKFHMIEWSWDPASTALWVVLIGNAFMNLYPMTADQTMVQRYLTTRTDRDAKRAVWTHAWLTIPITFLFFSLGTALWVYFRQHPEVLDPTLQNEAILPLFVTLEFPVGLKGVLIAGIFAAAMSSLDSSINSVASVIVNDYYRRYIPRVTEARAFFAARLVTLLFGIIGTAVAFYAARINAPSLWGPFLSLLSYVGSGISGVFALGVFTKRANGIGAICGAAASAAAVYGSGYLGIHDFVKGIVGVVVAFAVGYVVSRLTGGIDPPRGQEV